MCLLRLFTTRVRVPSFSTFDMNFCAELLPSLRLGEGEEGRGSFVLLEGAGPGGTASDPNLIFPLLIGDYLRQRPSKVVFLTSGRLTKKVVEEGGRRLGWNLADIPDLRWMELGEYLDCDQLFKEITDFLKKGPKEVEALIVIDDLVGAMCVQGDDDEASFIKFLLKLKRFCQDRDGGCSTKIIACSAFPHSSPLRSMITWSIASLPIEVIPILGGATAEVSGYLRVKGQSYRYKLEERGMAVIPL